MILYEKSKQLITNLSELEVQIIIQMQIRTSFPYGKNDDKNFELYRISTTKPHGYYLFRIVGEINPSTNGIIISYKICPIFLILLIRIILLFSLFVGLLRFLFNYSNELFLLLGLLFNAIFNLSIVWQKKEHIQRFESLFR